jgi:hypothetical protein
MQPDAFSTSSSRVDVNHVGLPACTYDTEDDGDGTETAGVQPDAPSPLPGLEDAQDDGVGGSRLSLRSLAPVILLQP